jgi:hypothetical protein
MREELPNLSHSFWICIASSRVGARTSMIGPSPRLNSGCALMCTIPGSRNASVLPDPVSATPIMSRPESATGQPCAWIADVLVVHRGDVRVLKVKVLLELKVCQTFI